MYLFHTTTFTIISKLNKKRNESLWVKKIKVAVLARLIIIFFFLFLFCFQARKGALMVALGENIFSPNTARNKNRTKITLSLLTFLLPDYHLDFLWMLFFLKNILKSKLFPVYSFVSDLHIMTLRYIFILLILFIFFFESKRPCRYMQRKSW